MLLIGLTILAAGLFYFWRNSPSFLRQEENTAYGSATYQAEVTKILETGEVTLGDHVQPYQILNVQVIDGPFSGQQFEVDYGQYQVRPADLSLSEGERILITISTRPDGVSSAYFTDYVRTPSLFWLLLIFILFSVLISGRKAVR
jgi:uncharacterized membrane protein